MGLNVNEVRLEKKSVLCPQVFSGSSDFPHVSWVEKKIRSSVEKNAASVLLLYTMVTFPLDDGEFPIPSHLHELKPDKKVLQAMNRVVNFR